MREAAPATWLDDTAAAIVAFIVDPGWAWFALAVAALVVLFWLPD